MSLTGPDGFTKVCYNQAKHRESRAPVDDHGSSDGPSQQALTTSAQAVPAAPVAHKSCCSYPTKSAGPSIPPVAVKEPVTVEKKPKLISTQSPAAVPSPEPTVRAIVPKKEDRSVSSCSSAVTGAKPASVTARELG